MNRNQRLALILLFWLAFALLLGQIASGLVRERIEELADASGLEAVVDELGGFVTIIWLVLVLFLSLILALRWQGSLASFARKLWPGSRAQERNRAGLTFFRQGGYAAAIAEFTEALRLNPRLGDALVNRGVCYFQLDKLDSALADLDAALVLKPTQLEALGWRGQVWFKKGDLEKALADYNEALRFHPDYPPALGNRAMIWVQKKEFDRALEDLNRAIALGARDALLHATRGSLYLGKEDYKRALDDCTTAILLGQAGPADFSNRGMAWLGQKNYPQAINDFDDALRLDPNFALAYNNRGVAYMKRGCYALAVADFHQAMQLEPTLPNSYKNLAWLQATCPEPEFRDGPAAVAHAQKALQLVDNQETAWFAILAAAYAEAGNFEDAVHWQMCCLDQSAPKLKQEEQCRLASYQARQPYRDELSPAALH